MCTTEQKGNHKGEEQSNVEKWQASRGYSQQREVLQNLEANKQEYKVQQEISKRKISHTGFRRANI